MEKSVPSLLVKNILFVIPSLKRGGAERVCTTISNTIDQTHNIHIATFDDSTPTYRYSGKWVHIKHRSKDSFIGKLINQKRRGEALAKLFEEIRPDNVISFMHAANIATIRANSILARGRIPSPRITISIHNSPSHFPFYIRLQSMLHYRKADRIIALTNQSKVELTRNWLLPGEKIHVIPNPVDSSFRGNLPIFENRQNLTILSVGRLVRQKRFDLAIRAVAQVATNYGFTQTISYTIIGDGPERAKLDQLCIGLPKNLKVSLPGAVDNVIPFLDSASVFLLSSDHEGFPMALAEAMARGCAIVASDCPTGPREMLDGGTCGLLTPVGNHLTMAKEIQTLLTNNNLRKKLGNAAEARSHLWNHSNIAKLWLQ